MGHLGEMRKRILWSALAIMVCCIGTFIARKYVFDVLMRPLKGTSLQTQKLVALSVTEPFMAILKISVYAGLVVSLPFILWQFWAFVLPALYENERKRVLPYVAASAGLFLGGVVFCYFLVLPVGIKWLLSFSSGQFNVLVHVDSYVSFCALFLLAFGAVFELPLIMMLLAWAGIVNYKQMRKVRRYAIVVEAVVAMVATPSGDPFTMLLMLAPLVALYEVGIWLSVIVVRGREKRRQAAAAPTIT